MNKLKSIEEFLNKKKLKFKKNKISTIYNNIKYIKLGKKKLKPEGISDFKIDDNISIYYFDKLVPEDYIYLSNIEDKALIFTKNIKTNEKIFTGSLSIVKVKESIIDKKINIEIKSKSLKKSINTIETEIGYGPYFINIYLPFRESSPNENIYHVSTSLIEKFINIGYIRGLRVRFIFFEYEFLNDIVYLSKMFKNNLKMELFIDEGFYKDIMPLVYKYNSNILISNLVLKYINSIEKNILPEIKFITKKSFDLFNFNKDIIWLYPYTKEHKFFLLEEDRLDIVSSSIYSLTKFIGKYLIK